GHGNMLRHFGKHRRGGTMTSRTLRRAAGLLVAGLAVLGAGCGRDLPQNTLAPVGQVARDQFVLFRGVFIVAAVVFFLVEGLILFAVIRFRASKRPGTPTQIHGNTTMELVWTVIPMLLLVIVAFPTVGGIWKLAKDPGPKALHVTVVGHQWWWEYQY